MSSSTKGSVITMGLERSPNVKKPITARKRAARGERA
jgi:hypothetical protein